MTPGAKLHAKRPAKGSVFDQDAANGLVSKARRLHRERYDADAVAEVTAALGQQLQNLIPTCSAIIKTLPDGAPGRPRLRALITTAEHALQRGPGHGATAALVHM